MTRLDRWMVGVLLAVATTGCGGDEKAPTAPSAPPSPTIAAVTVSGYNGTPMNRRNQTIQLAATARLSDGTTRDVTASAAWRSDAPSVAAVSSAGLVTAVGAGEATVVADYQGTSGNARVRVDLPTRAEPRVTGTITVRPSPEPIFLFRAEMTLTYREASGAVGMNVNFVNVTWRDYRGDLLVFRNYNPGMLAGIWGTNHIGPGASEGIVARIDYNRPISRVSVLVETSVQDDFGNVINFSDTFTDSLSLVPPRLPFSQVDFSRPVLFWDGPVADPGR